jgi:hypothetical protein
MPRRFPLPPGASFVPRGCLLFLGMLGIGLVRAPVAGPPTQALAGAVYTYTPADRYQPASLDAVIPVGHAV